MNVQSDPYLDKIMTNEIERAMRIQQAKRTNPVQDTWKITDPVADLSELNKYRKLSYKGVEFSLVLGAGVCELFNDPLDIQYEEMQMLSCLYPADYKSIKKVWMQAYITWQAEKEFEKP